MKCLGRDETVAWIRGRLPALVQWPAGFQRPDLKSAGYGSQRVIFPTDSGRKVWLARVLAAQLGDSSPVLVYLANIDIWPSSGHLPILVRLREAWGERRPLDESPGYLFDASEREDAVSLLVLALEFFWDCLVVPEDGRCVIHISHDEFVELWAADDAMLRTFQSVVEEPG